MPACGTMLRLLLLRCSRFAKGLSDTHDEITIPVPEAHSSLVSSMGLCRQVARRYKSFGGNVEKGPSWWTMAHTLTIHHASLFDGAQTQLCTVAFKTGMITVCSSVPKLLREDEMNRHSLWFLLSYFSRSTLPLQTITGVEIYEGPSTWYRPLMAVYPVSTK